MKTADLAELLPRFFSEYLIHQRNVSACTIAAYRDSFRLFLRFLQGARRSAPAELRLETVTAESVLAFLTYLEEHRHNSIRTRNARLAALRCFVHYLGEPARPRTARSHPPDPRHSQQTASPAHPWIPHASGSPGVARRHRRVVDRTP